MAKKKKEYTDADLVQMLSDGSTGAEISEETGINVRTLEARLTRIRDRSLSRNSAHVVANYFRKKLIK